MATRRDEHTISAEELRAGLRGSLVLDVRVGAGGRPDHAADDRARVPGARVVDLARDLIGPSTATSGDRPLPDPHAVGETLARSGFSGEHPIVVYDDTGSAAAARAWWTLRWAGLRSVRVLDGGLAAWIEAGGALESSASAAAEHTAPPVDIEPGGLRVATTADASRLGERGGLLDARPAALHAAGHIPGARSTPVDRDFDEHGRLRPPAEIAARYRAVGVRPGLPVATYCGSGMAAALQVYVLATIGIDAALYVGSLSQWRSDPTRPVAVAPTAARFAEPVCSLPTA
ncbi:sulfurtransferase [Gordonia sinesedis]